MRSQRRQVTGPRQLAMTAATVTAMLAIPRESISRPMRWEWEANQAWKSLGGRLFQNATSDTPMTSMPPASKPCTRHVRIRRLEATTDRPGESRPTWPITTFPPNADYAPDAAPRDAFRRPGHQRTASRCGDSVGQTCFAAVSSEARPTHHEE